MADDIFDKAEKAQKQDVFDQAEAPGKPIESTSTIGPAQPRSLMRRLGDWYMRKPTYQGTLAEPGRSPRDIVSAGTKGAGVASLPLIGYGLAAAPVATLLGLGGAAAGGAGGGYLGGKIGEQVGAPELGEDVGGLAGSVLGGTVGAGAARPGMNRVARLMRNPATARQSQLGRPGSVKSILPSFLQRYVLPEGLVPRGELGTPTRPGPFSEIPAKLPKDLRSDPFVPMVEATPIPAKVDPVAAAVKQGIASRVPTRMPRVAEPAPPVDPTAAAVKARTAMWIPSRMPAPKAAEPSPIVSPSRGAPLAEARMSGSEGRAATWTNEAVLREAAKGNREAIQQVVRRNLPMPEGARYVMGDPDFSRTVYNPRESTMFTPEGTPIRNVENPVMQAPRARIVEPPVESAPREVVNARTGEVTKPQPKYPIGKMLRFKSKPQGESRQEQILRGAAGESPTVKSIRRHYAKEK